MCDLYTVSSNLANFKSLNSSCYLSYIQHVVESLHGYDEQERGSPCLIPLCALKNPSGDPLMSIEK